MMRPQKKEQKRIQAMLASMEVGDTALTTSGFYGVIIDITDDDVIVEFGNNKNCRIPSFSHNPFLSVYIMILNIHSSHLRVM